MTIREPLPMRRSAFTFIQRWGNSTDLAVTYGTYDTPGAAPPLRIGEVFITGAKSGQEIEAILRDAAVLASLALQHGCPLEVINHALTREANGKPQSIIGTILERVWQESRK